MYKKTGMMYGESNQLSSKRIPKNMEMETGLIKNELVRKILVPVDYSQNSLQALTSAMHLAEKFDAAIVLLHVFHTPFADEHMPAEMVKDMIESQKMISEKEMMAFWEEHCKPFKQTVQFSHKTIMGFAAESIRDIAIAENCDLIMMGTRGGNSLQDKLFGTVTWNIIKNSKIPVIAIPEHTKFDEIKKIMMPFEGNLQDLETLDYLLEFSEKFDAEVHAVNFMIDNTHNKSFTDKLQQRFRKKIENDKLQLYYLSEKNITEGIRKFAQKNNMDMICMITHTHGLLSTIFHMSITRNIALYSEIPLLAYNADKQ